MLAVDSAQHGQFVRVLRVEKLLADRARIVERAVVELFNAFDPPLGDLSVAPAQLLGPRKRLSARLFAPCLQ